MLLRIKILFKKLDSDNKSHKNIILLRGKINLEVDIVYLIEIPIKYIVVVVFLSIDFKFVYQIII